MKRRSTCLTSARVGTFIVLSCLICSCDFGHTDYALDFAVRMRTLSTTGALVPGAVVRLTDGGHPINGNAPICVSSKTGRCEGQRSYRFGKTRFEWWGKASDSRLALTVTADGYHEVAISVNEFTRQEIAGIRTIERDVVLRPLK